MEEKYIDKIVCLAKKSYKKNDVPVGAIVVLNGKIIGKGYNDRKKKHEVTNHAEITAINKACNKIKDWRLNDAHLYVTLYPCLMCQSIIKESRISKVYYLIDKKENKQMYDNYIKIDNEEKYKDFLDLFKAFFQNLR